MDDRLTWQDAKAETQRRALEIAALIPAEQVAEVVQSDTGVLLSCDATQHNWNGWVHVELTDEVEVQSVLAELVPAAERYFAASAFTVSTGRTIVDTLRVIVEDPASAEMYLIDEDEPNVINIAAGSDCFTLPEDVYPGGDF